MKEKIRSFFFISGVLFPIVCQAMVAPGPNSLVFKSSSVLNSLPSKDVQSVYQDRDGYIWISTRNGLFQYDGYSITTYKSNPYCPDVAHPLTTQYLLCGQWMRNIRAIRIGFIGSNGIAIILKKSVAGRYPNITIPVLIYRLHVFTW